MPHNIFPTEPRHPSVNRHKCISLFFDFPPESWRLSVPYSHLSRSHESCVGRDDLKERLTKCRSRTPLKSVPYAAKGSFTPPKDPLKPPNGLRTHHMAALVIVFLRLRLRANRFGGSGSDQNVSTPAAPTPNPCSLHFQKDPHTPKAFGLSRLSRKVLHFVRAWNSDRQCRLFAPLLYLEFAMAIFWPMIFPLTVECVCVFVFVLTVCVCVCCSPGGAVRLWSGPAGPPPADGPEQH